MGPTIGVIYIRRRIFRRKVEAGYRQVDLHPCLVLVPRKRERRARTQVIRIELTVPIVPVISDFYEMDGHNAKLCRFPVE